MAEEKKEEKKGAYGLAKEFVDVLSMSSLAEDEVKRTKLTGEPIKLASTISVVSNLLLNSADELLEAKKMLGGLLTEDGLARLYAAMAVKMACELVSVSLFAQKMLKIGVDDVMEEDLNEAVRKNTAKVTKEMLDAVGEENKAKMAEDAGMTVEEFEKAVEDGKVGVIQFDMAKKEFVDPKEIVNQKWSGEMEFVSGSVGERLKKEILGLKDEGESDSE